VKRGVYMKGRKRREDVHLVVGGKEKQETGRKQEGVRERTMQLTEYDDQP
jgi:hypothetical protein